MDIQIEGNKKLNGTVTTNTSKNAAVGLLAASLLNKGTTTLHKVPKIEEVFRLIEVLESIGVTIAWEESTLTITPPTRLDFDSLDIAAAKRTRSIIMFMGPLLHHFDSFLIPTAGGCKLGARTVRPHLFALEGFGVDIEVTDDGYNVSHSGLTPIDRLVLYESGDTVTENALLTAARTPGTTRIHFASANYQVQDVCHFLTQLGVIIEGIGTTTLTITGVPIIDIDIEYTLSEDPIESMFFLTAALMTNSSMTIERCPIDFLSIELLKLEKMGAQFTISDIYTGANNAVQLVDITTHPSKLTAPLDKIESRPYPGLNIDNLPFFALLATQAKGRTLIHDWVYEKRAIYYLELEKLGADMTLLDPHRVHVYGKTPLTATEAICPPALRPGAILMLGMLAANGTSTLRNIYNINRGYDNIIERLNTLGAQITILS